MIVEAGNGWRTPEENEILGIKAGAAEVVVCSVSRYWC